MRSRDRGWLVLFLFFCSGATALVYEVVWSKFLSQMFGSTVYAQTVVLATFMGGLAIGNRLFGRWADGLKEPVRAYGYLEIAIALYALLFPTIQSLADSIFVGIGKGIADRTAVLLVLKGVLAAGLLLGPTILMGGTLPLLAAWLQKYTDDSGRRSARFYSVNSLGAVTGATLAGFWLVQNLGMIATLQMTALVNAVIGGVAVLITRGDLLAKPAASAAKAETAVAPAAAPSAQLLRWAGLIVAMTGGVSMGLEILSARSLAMIFGSSLQSFAIVLMAFILGIGLGSAWIASPKRRVAGSEALIVMLLCFAAAWVALLVFNIERWVDFYRMARIGLSRTATGYFYHQLLATSIALFILGVPAACIGAVLPLIMRAVAQAGELLGARVGALLTWNTLGAVGGTLFTGFVLMPVAGLRNAFGVLALTLGVMALIVAWRHRLKAGLAGAVAVCALAGGLFFFGGEGWRHVISSGVFRVHETEFDAERMVMRKQEVKILFYEDAPDATVSVEEVLETKHRGLRINGKPDASTRGDVSTQLLLAHLPMLVKPGAKDVFLLGLGSGISAGALLPYPMEQLIIGENCEPVIRAVEHFEPWNRGVLKDPRVKVWAEDARTVLKLHEQRYDVIITQPSNPWTAGIGSVFSQEYYQIAASRLKEGGIVAQWFQLYDMSDPIVALVLRTFASVFPFVEIWDTADGDIIMLGSMTPWRTGPEIFSEGFKVPRIREDMASIGIGSPEALMVRQLAGQRTGFAIAGDGPIQIDLFPVLEYAAPKAFYIGAKSRMLGQFDERTRHQSLAWASKRRVLQLLPRADVEAVFRTYASVNPEFLACVRGATDVPCILSPGSAQPASGHAAVLEQAVAALNANNFKEAQRLLDQVVKASPGDPDAAFIGRIIEREQQLQP